MIRIEPEQDLQEELLETGELLDHYISLEGQCPEEQEVLDGMIYKLLSRHMRLTNERSMLYRLLAEVNTGHPVPIVFLYSEHG